MRLVESLEDVVMDEVPVGLVNSLGKDRTQDGVPIDADRLSWRRILLLSIMSAGCY